VGTISEKTIESSSTGVSSGTKPNNSFGELLRDNLPRVLTGLMIVFRQWIRYSGYSGPFFKNAKDAAVWIVSQQP
jgi:hypothetical protein